jgi:hypothetical protein
MICYTMLCYIHVLVNPSNQQSQTYCGKGLQYVYNYSEASFCKKNYTHCNQLNIWVYARKNKKNGNVTVCQVTKL